MQSWLFGARGWKSHRDAHSAAASRQPNITLTASLDFGSKAERRLTGVNCFICKYQIMLSFQLNQVNLKFRFRRLLTYRYVLEVCSAVSQCSAVWRVDDFRPPTEPHTFRARASLYMRCCVSLMSAGRSVGRGSARVLTVFNS